jgi:hypothetical protein
LHAVSADAAPRRVLAAGRGGASRSDCLVEWTSTAPLANRPARAVPAARFLCTDGDPSCDTDDVADQCTIEIAPCTAVADSRLPLCAPAQPAAVSVSTRTTPNPMLEASLAASLDSVLAATGARPGSCGAAVPVVLPLAGRGRANVTLRVVAQGAAAGDRESIRLICKRAAAP